MKSQTLIPEWLRFLKNMFAWFNILLWFASILCFFAYGIEYSSDEEPDMDNVSLKFSSKKNMFYAIKLTNRY
jgi:hypothetical protein